MFTYFISLAVFQAIISVSYLLISKLSYDHNLANYKWDFDVEHAKKNMKTCRQEMRWSLIALVLSPLAGFILPVCAIVASSVVVWFVGREFIDTIKVAFGNDEID